MNENMTHPSIRYAFIRVSFWLGIALTAVVFGQAENKIGLNCSLWAGFDDNAFRNYQMLSDVVYQPNAVFYYSRRTDRSGFRMDYEGSLAVFQNFMNRKFQHHFLGVNGDRMLGDSGSVSIYWGLKGGRRWNEPEYAYYDYGNGSAYLNARFGMGEKGSVGLGFSGQIQDYRELKQFNFYEVRGYIQPTLTLPTRTTLIGQFQIGGKKFTEPVESQEIVRQIVTVKRAGSGKGKGRGIPGNPNADVTRYVVVNRIVTVSSPGKSVTQFTGLLRAAQSVFSGTGVAVQGIFRRNLKRDGRILSYQDSGYEQEDVLFDDPYSYSSDELSLEWTQMLPWRLTLKAGIETKDKRYDYAASDAEGNSIAGTLRHDRRAGFWLTLKKTIRIGGFSPQPVFYFTYSFTENRSNDAYYDYSNKVSSVGMSLGF